LIPIKKSTTKLFKEIKELILKLYKYMCSSRYCKYPWTLLL